MSMLDIAKYLYYARSIDVSHDEDRFFNLSDVDRKHHYLFLYKEVPKKRSFFPSCVRGKSAENYCHKVTAERG